MALPENVVVLERGDKTYYLLGTAHISQRSVDEVGQLIEEVQPDTVCVELCQTRYETLTNENQWKKLNVVEVLKQGKALLLLANLALSAFQRKMGRDLGVKPGAELLAAVEQAEAHEAELVLADREIQITLKRTWGNLSFWRKMMVMAGLVEAVVVREKISEEDLEKMKESDQLTEMMEAFAKEMATDKKPLIDERDQFLMSSIEEAPGQKIVGVVGAGHLKGMQDWFGTTVDREEISKIPAPSKVLTVLKWVIPLVILGLFAVGWHNREEMDFVQMLYAWILPNAIGSALFTVFARAHILTIITAGVAAPITSLNPAIGAGMVAGFVEAMLRKPSVEDCERIPEDIESLKGFYSNRFTRVLLVFALATLGSALGTWVGGAWVVSLVAAN